MNEWELRLKHAEQLIMNHEVEDGLAVLNDMLYDEPGSAELHNLLGWGYLYFENNAERAALHFRAAIAFAPRYAPPYVHLGHLCNQKGRFIEALEWFDRGVGLPEASRLAFCEGMGWAYEMRREYKKAIRCYREAMAVSASPDFERLRESVRRCRVKRWTFLPEAAA